MHVEWRREEVPGPPTGELGEPALVDAIRTEILEQGPITFARFMQRALYEPGLGYYATAVERPTRAGDFLTAPELHPIFGATLARQVDEIWQRLARPNDFVLREFGAGSGALGLAILDGLARRGSALTGILRYQPVDLPLQRAAIAQKLAEAGRAAALDEAPDDSRFVGCLIANEFLDALPVHRLLRLNGELREIHVAWRHERFTEVAGPLSDSTLVDLLPDAGAGIPEGQRTEVRPAQAEWLATLAASLERGVALVIDYGSDGPRDSLRAFRGQHVSSDALQSVGQIDITADVDFGALERQARAAGLDVLARRRAAEFLLAAGLEDEYQAARATADSDWESAAALRAAVRRLLDPAALGGYHVAVFGRGVGNEPPLAGLAPLPGRRG